MSPFLEQYAASIGTSRPPLLARRNAAKRGGTRRVCRVLYQQRPCFICETSDVCIHREPELLITTIEDVIDVW